MILSNSVQPSNDGSVKQENRSTILFASSEVGAMRPLEGEQWLKKESLLRQSVQRGWSKSMHLHPWSQQGHVRQVCHVAVHNLLNFLTLLLWISLPLKSS